MSLSRRSHMYTLSHSIRRTRCGPAGSGAWHIGSRTDRGLVTTRPEPHSHRDGSTGSTSAPDGTLWIGGSAGGVCRYDGTTWVPGADPYNLGAAPWPFATDSATGSVMDSRGGSDDSAVPPAYSLGTEHSGPYLPSSSFQDFAVDGLGTVWTWGRPVSGASTERAG